MEFTSMFDNMSIKDEIDDFDQYYGHNDAEFKFLGVHRDYGIEHIRPTNKMREIQLGNDQWIKFVKIQEPIGLSSQEYWSECFTYNNVWRFGRPLNSYWESTSDFNENMIINSYHYNDAYGGMPIYYQRLLNFGKTINPKISGLQLQWYTTTSNKQYFIQSEQINKFKKRIRTHIK